MLKPSADIILGPKESRYSLVVAVAKRAREIAANAESRGDILIEKPVDLAVHEIMDHKYIIIEHVEPNDDLIKQ
jgi:DNA-directed RNA polymerase subunit omega